MKLILLCATMVLTLTTWASSVGPNSTWSEIIDAGLEPQIPKMWFGTIGVSVINTCMTESQILTISPVTFCAEYGHGQASTDCVRFEKVRLAKAKSYSSRECSRYAAQHECVEWSIKQNEYPSKYRIAVLGKPRSHNGRGDHQAPFQFYKDFTVPTCQ